MPDYPDFTQYAAIDIVNQTLDRVLNRPTYGGALTSAVNVTAIANDDKTLMTVTGEGMLYGGWLIVQAGDVIDNSSWFTVLDGNSQYVAKFGTINNFNLWTPSGVTPYTTFYDDVNNKYAFLIPYGITFDTSFSCVYREEHGDTPNVQACMYYALT